MESYILNHLQLKLFPKVLPSLASTILIIISLSFSSASRAQQTASYEKGLETFEQGQFAESYIYLKNSLQKDPDHLPSKLLIGRILLIDGYLNDAITEFLEVIDKGADKGLVIIPLANAYFRQQEFVKVIELSLPKSVDTSIKLDLQLLKAAAHIRLKQINQADDLLRQAQRDFGDDIRLLNGLSQTQLIMKNYAGARQLIEQALGVNPKHGQARLFSGLIYQAQEQSQLALSEFELAYQNAPKNPSVQRALANSYAQLNMLQKAKNLILEIEQQNPNDMQLKLLKVKVLAKENNIVEGERLITELVQALSVTTDAQKENMDWLNLVEGITAHITGNYETAVREISRYLQGSNPTSSIVAILAEGYIKLDNPKLAIKTLELHNSVIIDDLGASSLLCDLYLVSGRIFKCSSLIKQLQEVHGQQGALIFLEAKILHLRNNTADAIIALDNPAIDSQAEEVILLKTSMLAGSQRFEQALTQASKLLIIAPNNIQYMNINIDLLLRNNRIPAADNIAQQALSIEPQNSVTKVNMSRVKFAQQQYAVSLALLNEILTVDPSNQSALLLSAQVLIRTQQLEQAIENLISLKILDATNPSASELLVSIYKSTEQHQLVIAELKELLKIQRLAPQYIAELAIVHTKLKQFTEAKQQLRLLSGIWSNNPQQLVILSQMQRRISDFAAAKLSLQSAQKQAPGYLLAKLEYGRLLLKTEEFAAAEIHIMSLLEAYGDNANYWLLQGHYHKAVGEVSQAINAYQKAISVSPEFTLAYIQLYQLAATHLNRTDILDIFENLVNNTTGNQFYHHLLADLYFLYHEYDKAKTLYQALMLADDLPNKDSILNNLANIESTNDLEQALLYAQQAYELNSNSAEILDTRGWLLVLNGDLTKGLNVLRQAYTLQSNAPTVRYHLAYALNQLGRKNEARTQLQKALLYKGHFRQRQAAKLLLEQLI